MDSSPIGDPRFSWLGWDRSGNTPTTGTGIHHPSGDVMKISFDNNQLIESSYLSNLGTSHWKVDWDDGVTEGGSSSSPLFDQNQRVIGQLHGGYSGCNSNDMRDWYGSFHRSWTIGGTNATRLSNWLDPCNTGAVTTNTSRSPYLTGPSVVCISGTSFMVGNLPSGTTIEWNQSSNLSRNSPQGSNPCIFKASGIGSGWVEANIVTDCGGFILPRKNVQAVRPSGTWTQNSQVHPLYTVNFVDNQSWIQANVTCPDSTAFNWELTGSSGINWSQNNYNDISYLNLYLNSSSSYADFRLNIDTQGCGTISPTYHFVPGYMYAFILSPNPAENEVFITRVQKDMINKTNRNVLKPKIEKFRQKEFLYNNEPFDTYTIRLYSEKQGLLKTVNTREESFRIDLSGLPSGIYFLHIENDYVFYKEKLIINRK